MADPAERPRVADAGGERLAVVEDERAAGGLEFGDVPDGGFDGARVRVVLARQEPVARALEDDELLGLGGDLGDELDRARARADDRDALARQVVVVVPLGGVERVPLEGARQLRRVRAVELAGGDDQRVGGERATVGGGEGPAVVVVRGGDLRVQRRVDAVLVRELADVGEDLVARGAQPRPVAALLERERVQVARDVARRARVVVEQPRAADVVRAVDEEHVVLALQRDRRRDPAEPRPDDRDPHRRDIRTRFRLRREYARDIPLGGVAAWPRRSRRPRVSPI